MAQLLIEMSAGSVGPDGSCRAKPGDILRGQLVLRAAHDQPLILNKAGLELYLLGFEHTTIVTWDSGSLGDQLRTDHGGGQLLRETVWPLPQQNEHVFPPGAVRTFPFALRVPIAPQTTLTAVDKYGRQPEEEGSYTCSPRQKKHKATAGVEYEIKCVGHLAGLPPSHLLAPTIPLILEPVFPLSPNPLGLAAVTATGAIHVPSHLGCDWFGSRPITASVRVPRVCLANGESLTVVVSVKNESKRAIDRCTLALQRELTISTYSGPLPQVRRHVTVHRVVKDLVVAPRTAAESQHVLRIANLTPDVHGTAFTSTSVLLVRLHVRDSKKHIDVRIPLQSPYTTDYPRAPIPSPILVSSPAEAHHPQPPQQSDSMEGQAEVAPAQVHLQIPCVVEGQSPTPGAEDSFTPSAGTPSPSASVPSSPIDGDCEPGSTDDSEHEETS